MRVQVLVRNRVGADDHLDRIALFQESLERRNMRARWVANEHAGGQMNDFGAIFEHFVCGVFDVAAWATIASRKSDQIKFGIIIVSTLPLLVLYPFLQKYFVKGIMIGSIKG